MLLDFKNICCVRGLEWREKLNTFFSDCSEAIIVKTRMDKEEGFKNLFFRADLGYDIFPFMLTIILDNGLKIKLDFSGFFRNCIQQEWHRRKSNLQQMVLRVSYKGV